MSPLRAVVGLRELPRRLDRLRAAGGEEHAVEVARRELRDARREFDRGRVRVAPVRVEAELLGLRGGRLAELGAAVADVHAVERREAVEVALAVLVVDVAALAPDDHGHRVVLVVGAHAREVHPQVAPRQLLEPVGVLGQGRAPRAGAQVVAGRAGRRPPRGPPAFTSLPAIASLLFAFASRAGRRAAQLDTQDNHIPVTFATQGASWSNAGAALYELYRRPTALLGQLPLARPPPRA